MHRSSGTKLSATDSSGGLEGADHMWNHAMIWCWFNRSFSGQRVYTCVCNESKGDAGCHGGQTRLCGSPVA